MELFDLSGRAALVTGGGRGLGLGMARGLAAAGAALALVDLDPAAADEGAHTLEETGARVIALAADVTDAGQVEQAMARVVAALGRLDILVNNVGARSGARPEDLPEADWDRVMDTNLTSYFLCAKACHPHLKVAGGGKIINNASVLANLGFPLAPDYCASKGGVVQLTRALATAWAPDNIQVNAILPGWSDTAFTLPAREGIPGFTRRIEQRTPAGRWGRPEDFRGAAVYLASSASDFITGAGIVVDGGYSALG